MSKREDPPRVPLKARETQPSSAFGSRLEARLRRTAKHGLYGVAQRRRRVQLGCSYAYESRVLWPDDDYSVEMSAWSRLFSHVRTDTRVNLAVGKHLGGAQMTYRLYATFDCRVNVRIYRVTGISGIRMNDMGVITAFHTCAFFRHRRV